MARFSQFADKFVLAQQASEKIKPSGGLCGFELEWNLLNSEFHPLLMAGSGPTKQSFVDYLRAECLSPQLREYSQLEVFHWMIEWATRPYYSPRAVIYEARLMEAALINALSKAGRQLGERLYLWHGNLPVLTDVNFDSIPGSWHLAKRRYLERCVELYGESLATAGTHTNLSLPDSLFEWDFIHLPAIDRTGRVDQPLHLDEFKSEFYITATRLMRAFACLFIATSASTPFQAGMFDGKPTTFLTRFDSVRNLTFPNPVALDLPNLYRSYQDYLQLSYDLVRQGIRFGNNNWTPIRARSFAEPVERLIAMTSEQLQDLYARGLYVAEQDNHLNEIAKQIEMQNLFARINLPMERVEVRTDDGSHHLDEDVAFLTLKFLLLVRFYADSEFARAFRYDREDIRRARRNEENAARNGMRAEIENPFTGKPISMRGFLSWTLSELMPLAEDLGLEADLAALQILAGGGQNAAERLRDRVCLDMNVGMDDTWQKLPVPQAILLSLAEERESQVMRDADVIAETFSSFGMDSSKLGELIQHAREDVNLDPLMPVRFRTRPEVLLETAFSDKTGEIVVLTKQLIEIPSVTACPEERLDEVNRAAVFIYDYLHSHGVEVRYFNQSKYPALLAGFPQQMDARVMLCGHFDVVPPEPDDSQFIPHIEGDYLWGRGAADMKTVVATYLVWMKDVIQRGEPYPPINLLLVGNEENGETEPMGTLHVLNILEETGYIPKIMIAGERTGERGNELWGEICTQNRGVMRFEILARGQKGHSGTSGGQADLTERLMVARSEISQILTKHLTLTSEDGWQSQARFPFIQVGTPGVYNITPDLGSLGLEVRPIPQDDISQLIIDLERYCQDQNLELRIPVKEGGIACDPENPYLRGLIDAAQRISGDEPKLGRKLAGTSARFAPHGQGVVWGQSGLGAHAKDERHFIPSILPYYQVLDEYARILLTV